MEEFKEFIPPADCTSMREGEIFYLPDIRLAKKLVGKRRSKNYLANNWLKGLVLMEPVLGSQSKDTRLPINERLRGLLKGRAELSLNGVFMADFDGH